MVKVHGHLKASDVVEPEQLKRDQTARGEKIGNLNTRRFWGDGDVYKRASLGKRAPSFPPRSKLKQRGFFATATLSKPASKA